jgi:4-hydroxy-tetrahydrodipicolinate reductase
MTTSIAIMGAAGRMGQSLVRCVPACPNLRLAVALERAGHPALGKDAGAVASIDEVGVPLVADLDAVSGADVLIDFSEARAVAAHVATAVRHGKGMVIGTTGLDGDTEQAIRTAAGRVAIVWAPNMSLGVNVLFELLRQASHALGLDYDVEIVDTHHRHKKDAPSGTAMYLAKAVALGRDQNLADAACYGRVGMPGERPRGEIGIHALRSGSIVGDHVVTLASETEVVGLSHRAMGRESFAMGALRAAGWLSGRSPGLYGMRDVLALG